MKNNTSARGKYNKDIHVVGPEYTAGGLGEGAMGKEVRTRKAKGVDEQTGEVAGEMGCGV